MKEKSTKEDMSGLEDSITTSDKPLDSEVPKLVKLDIGSGGKSSDSSFIGIDAYTEADINALMWDLPFADESVDVIFCAQALEHCSKQEVFVTLQEWKRVLKPNGKLQIIVPDFEWAVKMWLGHRTWLWPYDVIFGQQTHAGDFHKTGFTSQILEDILRAFEFKIHLISYLGGVDNTQRSINIEAYK